MKTFLSAMALALSMAMPVSVFSAGRSASGDIEAVDRLTRRVAPSLAGSIRYELIPAECDTFAVTADNGMVVIKGNNAISMSVGLNNYLRRDLGVSVSWFADDSVQVPDDIVIPATGYGARAAVGERFFLNYCTFGYTMPYWNWGDWERFIDWMALNGINLRLAMTGQERTWQLTWRRLGLDDASIMSSFTGPAHLPWHWMNNVDHFQGPLAQPWIDSQESLQRSILERERELGMTPVMPAFAGHVPDGLRALYPDARISLRSQWSGFEDKDRCWFLDPSDPLYATIQNTFLSIQDSIYGTDHIYGIDPFNEVDSPDWSEEYLRSASSGIYSILRAADPDARWLQMTWNFYYDRKHWTKPRIKAFLDGVPDENLLLLDYFCDRKEIWRMSDAYFGKPFIWCYLGNFGGNTMMVGDMADIDRKISAVVAEAGSNLAGIGGTLEGFSMNPVIDEYVFAKVWEPGLGYRQWADRWAGSRGAKVSDAIARAWRILADSVYVKCTRVGEACQTNSRPFVDKPTGGYTNSSYRYSQNALVEALRLMLSDERAWSNAALSRDAVNIGRQLLGNHFASVRDSFVSAYRRMDIPEARRYAADMENVISGIDTLMSTNPNTTLAKWVSSARAFGKTSRQSDSLEVNARTLLTVWGLPGRKLNDYANRQWAGLLSDFYLQRWKMFTDAVISAMEEGREYDEAAFVESVKVWEGEWPEKSMLSGLRHAEMPGQSAVSPESTVSLVRSIMAKYFPEILNKTPEIE
ncbi:alpha-N-acetylglucosaminidase [Muribaculum intestinale]|uniref:alpha-N-acetylglucosaminidase n=1 Tax=Muribaculum intestinale TaxID=1796646 RepID=UPI00242BB25F|nr:alpha-N-acetylglucosaminidase [Muribaculum intestinale]